MPPCSECGPLTCDRLALRPSECWRASAFSERLITRLFPPKADVYPVNVASGTPHPPFVWQYWSIYEGNPISLGVCSRTPHVFCTFIHSFADAFTENSVAALLE